MGGILKVNPAASAILTREGLGEAGKTLVLSSKRAGSSVQLKPIL
jgi:hypothetical protein